jgi:Zn-dependent M28 family amino/carboxypeptidase
MHQRSCIGLLVAMGISLFMVGCDETGLSEADTRLGELAFQEVATLIEAHPQRIAGVHSQAVADTLVKRLTHSQRTASQLPFSTPQGTMVNVLYSAPKGVEPKLLLVSHFDTKVGIDNFVGANDGASTTGLLIALANHTDWPILCLFTDGEECLNQYVKGDGLHGSWHAAKQGIGGDLPVLVLDMLGDKDYTPSLATNASDILNARVRAAAKRAGFSVGSAGAIIDDHIPFYAHGRRVANLIDFDFGKDNAYWHTANDTLENIGASSLAKTTTLLRYLIEELQNKDTTK